MYAALTVIALVGSVVAQRPSRIGTNVGSSDFKCNQLDSTSQNTVCVDQGASFFVGNDGIADTDIGGAGRADVKILVPFRYNRRDDEVNEDVGYECGPEVRLKIDGQVVAHSEAKYVDGGKKYPKAGEGYFKVKVSLTKGTQHSYTVEFRDGETCDLYDDDDDAEKRTWATTFTGSCIRAKRSVSLDDDDDSSSGTTVSITSVREQQRIVCLSLENNQVRMEFDDSSSSDDDDSSSSSSSSSSD